MHLGRQWSWWACGLALWALVPSSLRAQASTARARASGGVAPATAAPGSLPLGTRVPLTFLSDPPGYTLYRMLEGGVSAGVSLGNVGADTDRRFRPLCTAPCQLTLTVGGQLVGYAHGVRAPKWASVEIPGPGVLRVYPHPVASGWRWYWRVLDGMVRYLTPFAAIGALVDGALLQKGEENLVFDDVRTALVTSGALFGSWFVYIWLVRPPLPYQVVYQERIRWEPYAQGP